ncbi:thiol reductant ABC exporter subunit CydC [Gemella sp. 19428wG2_WT2a]|nr:thiol reductant ABC exporter subunit CydC [Gemella sp. 19428wG2_WT2a]TFU60489.1 thiol reductant ABC exporter subunit CydC [Gemella sp. WT2a]
MNKTSIIRNELKNNKFKINLIVILGVISAVSGIGLMYISGFLISKSALKIGNILLLQVPAVLTRTFSLTQSVFSYLHRLIGHDLVLKLIEKMRSKVYIILEPMALRLKKEYKSGDLLGLLSEDIDHLQNIYLKTIFPAIISLIVYTVFIAIMVPLDYYYSLLALTFGFFIIFVVPFLSLYLTKNKQVIVKKSKHKLYTNLTSAVLGITDFISANKVENLVHEYKTNEIEIIKAEKKIKSIVHLREITLQFLATLVVTFMIYSCMNMSINNTIENVYIASFCMIALSVLSVVLMTGEAISHIPTYKISIDRVKEFYSNKEEVDNVEYNETNYNNIIEIKNLKFAYDNTKMILNDISLSVKKGEKVAILGRSGVGKSTLIKLITGTYKDYEGSIKVFGNLPSENLLGKKISMLNQKPYLFDMSIKDNLELSNIDSKNVISISRIEDSLEKSQMKQTIDMLPDGIYTNVYESGTRFSGGERQRIALARTLIQNNELLLLDEPTVGLDPKTETDLLNTIFKNNDNKTIIWITHHLNSIEYMDRIIFINNGKIEMDGSHEELYESNYKYKKLYDMDRGY